MIDFAKWLAENWRQIGPVGFLILTWLGIVWIFATRKVIPAYYHDELVKSGKEALGLLPAVNTELQESKTLAAVQKVRDEYGLREKDDMTRRLDLCLTDLGRCRDRERGSQ